MNGFYLNEELIKLTKIVQELNQEIGQLKIDLKKVQIELRDIKKSMLIIKAVDCP